jgi:hypothetical protein
MDAASRAELISELDAAVARGSPERRNVILLRILLSATGLAYRRCSLVWIDGSQVGVHFIPRDSKKKEVF